MYALFFTIEDLLHAAARWGTELHLLALQRGLPLAGIPRQESSLYLTPRVPPPPPPGAPDLLAGRIVLERFEAWPPEHEAALHTSSTARADQTVALVRAAAAASGVPVADYGSVLGAPGLLPELLTIHTQQELWRYERPAPDPTTWALVPRAGRGGGPAMTSIYTPAPARCSTQSGPAARPWPGAAIRRRHLHGTLRLLHPLPAPLHGREVPALRPPAPAPLGTFQVWQRTAFLPPRLSDEAARHRWRQQRGEWIHVADVRAPSWEAAFDLTNTYDEQIWYTRAEVTLHVDPADPQFDRLDRHLLHSTSVGDVLVAGDWVQMVGGSGWLDL